MNIVFFGIPDMGAVCLNGLIAANIPIKAVVPPKPDHPSHKYMVSIAAKAGIPVYFFYKSPSEQSFIKAIKNLEPDICIVCSFDSLLPKELLEIPKIAFLNCHPSLLPAYRGANPYFHVIANNEKKTGVTIHYMDEGFDTGDIIVQKEVEIFQNETIGTLFNRLNYESSDLVVDTLKKFIDGYHFKRLPQLKTGNFPTAPKFNCEKGENMINWERSSEDIERFIRACNPVYGAMSCFRNYFIKIWSARYDMVSDSSAYTPGTVVIKPDGNFMIATGKGFLYPITLQIGFSLITDIYDFVARVRPENGEQFFPGGCYT